MKPITEQRRQKLIADCQKEIGNLMLWLECGPLRDRSKTESELLRQQIALASLTAVPVSEVISLSAPVLDGMIAPMNGYRGISNLAAIKRLPEGTNFYTAPPVPVIKLPEINLRIAGYRHAPSAPTKEWAFMDGAKWMASETKRLNGLGE